VTDERTVIIIEDNLSVRQALVKIVTQFGMQAYSTGDPDHAFDTWRMVRPDIVILDWDLDGQLTGVDIANQAFNEDIYTQVIFITGKSIRKLKQRTVHLPITAYLKKPFRLKDLKTALSLCD
jgi:DNA-binding response OmpR family regulator